MYDRRDHPLKSLIPWPDITNIIRWNVFYPQALVYYVLHGMKSK